MTTLTDALSRVAAEYANEKTSPFKGSPLAGFIRGDGAQALTETIGRPDLKVEGSPGKGNWSEVPWYGVFNPEITESATSGVYVVYLFAANLAQVYLCLAQGVTAIQMEFGKDREAELLRRSALARSRVPEFSREFRDGPIALGGNTTLAKDYDKSVIYFTSYDLSRLPSEAQLQADLRRMIDLYDLVVSRGGTDNVGTAIEFGLDDANSSDTKDIEEQRRYVRHSRIERSTKAAVAAKKVHGHVCQGCGIDFERFYGERGKGYIEAHHLIPLHTLPVGKPVSMDPKKDFAVLCSNCHRMVHKGSPLLTIEELRSMRGVKALRRAFEKRKGS